MLSPALLRPLPPSIARTPITNISANLAEPKLVQSLLPPFPGRPPNLLPSSTKQARRPLRLLSSASRTLDSSKDDFFSCWFPFPPGAPQSPNAHPPSRITQTTPPSPGPGTRLLSPSLSRFLPPPPLRSPSHHSVSLISASASSRIRTPFTPSVDRIPPSHHTRPTSTPRLPRPLSLLPTASCTLPPLLVPHHKVCIAANTTCVYMRTS